MNSTVVLLNKAADMEKKAYFDYVTSLSSAGIAALVKGGVSFEKAASLVEEACLADTKLQSIAANFTAFEKAAEYIEEQDARIQELEKIAAEVESSKEIIEVDSFNKLASAGFSKEEIELMSDLPENLLTKVASAKSQPWEMGGGAGLAREKTDPLLEWILT